MVCMGGLTAGWTPEHTLLLHIDSEYTLCHPQYITPWPFTHPCCALAFFGFPWPVTGGREERCLRKHYVIWHRSRIFEFLVIVWGMTSLNSSVCCCSESQTQHWNRVWYTWSLHNKSWDVQFHNTVNFLASCSEGCKHNDTTTMQTC